MEFINGEGTKSFDGCDFVIQLGEKRANTKIKILQITDMQFIDSLQRRTPERLRIDEINAWHPSTFDANGGNQIRTLISQAVPDLIIITGDIVYGSFDDNGTTLEWFCKLMDSFKIPWAPVFGNHDNESAKGVKWQCEQFEKAEYCLFKRGIVSGNGNYTVGIATGDKLARVVYMLDSNGCESATDPEVITQGGIFLDQAELIKKCYERISAAQGRIVPGFIAFHIPCEEFATAVYSKYSKTTSDRYVLGVDVPAKDGDYGASVSRLLIFKTDFDMLNLLHECNIEGVFAGHCHHINTCINYEGIRWVIGLKTAQYDGHNPGQNGGTVITVDGDKFDVHHIPSLALYSPFPGGSGMFKDFFAEDKFIISK